LGQDRAAGDRVSVNGAELYYELHGQGAPLVLLHGNGGSMGDFQNQIGVLAAHFQVIGVDSRCQGKSGGDPATLSYRQMAADVEALLVHLGAGPAFVLGFSDGGIVGLLLALRAPAAVRALAVSGANVMQDESAFPRETLEAMRAALADATSPLDRALNAMMLGEPSLAFEELTEGIRCPTLVMAGDRDVIRPEHTLGIFRAIPGAELCLFPASDHFFFVENPSLFNQVVLGFFLKH
jgi:pimeloyl-ACP methyl ester carboxylesterase